MTTVYPDDAIIIGKMDEPLPGAEPWDNSIEWTSNEGFGASLAVARQFNADTTPIYYAPATQSDH